MRLSWIVFLMTFGCTALAATPEENKDMIRRFLKLVGSEDSTEIVKTGKLPGILADDIHGRVNPVGTFNDQEGTIEYFIGLGGAVGVPDTVVESVDIQTLIGDSGGVYAHFVVSWKSTKTGEINNRVALDGRFKLNDDGLISAYDLNAISLGKGMDQALAAQPLLTKAGICYQIQQTCIGANQVYKDFFDCFMFLNSIPLGTFHEAQSNSVTCRSVHINLAGFRPEVHCPHVSREGGGKCIDVPYLDYFKFSLDLKPDPNHQHVH